MFADACLWQSCPPTGGSPGRQAMLRDARQQRVLDPEQALLQQPLRILGKRPPACETDQRAAAATHDETFKRIEGDKLMQQQVTISGIASRSWAKG
jgi:hypothetical protein